MKKPTLKNIQNTNSSKVQNSNRRTTSLDFKKQMENIATSGKFTTEERLKAFRS
ncbi:hypothetical protein GW796_08335 [archaeon]|nr:hypothetical protein [archaeon]